MRTKLRNFWEKLSSSYWFLPAVMVLLAVGLSKAMVELDRRMEESPLAQFGWTYKNVPDGARAVLSVIAGSMITVAGVVFSITIVALSLASQQFGPRVLRNFMRDRGNQVALGTFVATFIYCVLVLRTVQETEGNEFVPNAAVTIGVLLAVFSIGVLIFTIHHIAESIQASKVISAVGTDLDLAVARLFPDRLGHELAGDRHENIEIALPRIMQERGRRVASAAGGYVQAVVNEGLMELATERDLIIELRQRPGDYVAPGATLARIWPKERVNDELERAINGAFLLGADRTQEQDLRFPLNQLVEVAVRSLSPGIDDPFTALQCIDHLSAGLASLARRHIPSAMRSDREGRLRLIARPTTFDEALRESFGPILESGRRRMAIVRRMLEALEGLAGCAKRPEDQREIRIQADRILRAVNETLPDREDRALLARLRQEVLDRQEER
jgi:uncharacterized membrane protein